MPSGSGTRSGRPDTPRARGQAVCHTTSRGCSSIHPAPQYRAGRSGGSGRCARYGQCSPAPASAFPRYAGGGRKAASARRRKARLSRRPREGGGFRNIRPCQRRNRNNNGPQGSRRPVKWPRRYHAQSHGRYTAFEEIHARGHRPVSGSYGSPFHLRPEDQNSAAQR